MTLQQMIEYKNAWNWTNEMISGRSGVPVSTVRKIFSGATAAPRYATLCALEAAFLEETWHRDPDFEKIKKAGCLCDPHPLPEGYTANRTAEAVPVYQIQEKKPGEYTLEDYYALPDDQRVELIDGTFFVMETPGVLHQIIDGLILHQLFSYIAEKGGSCIPLAAPTDVQLDCDDRTMVEPDVLVVCYRSKLKDRCVYGAPDLVMEILSPATRTKDLYLKPYKYQAAGVREYWIIYPKEEKVLVYDFDHDVPPMISGFDAKIPVGIFDGDCVIDFCQIRERTAFLRERPEDPD